MGRGVHFSDIKSLPSAKSGSLLTLAQTTNLKLCMRLISEGKFNVDAVTTHKIPLVDVELRLAEIIQEPDRMLGVVFEMN